MKQRSVVKLLTLAQTTMFIKMNAHGCASYLRTKEEHVERKVKFTGAHWLQFSPPVDSF